jgi:mono/diheme cytochrome c family protein
MGRLKPKKSVPQSHRAAQPTRFILACMLAVAALSLLIAARSSAQARRHSGLRSMSLADWPISPVDGRSWLHRLGIVLEETYMGKTGAWGPGPEVESGAEPNLIAGFGSPTVMLSGADIYRLECQGCHRSDGRGVPGEINSMIDPVRATSPEMIRSHMQKIGAPVSVKAAGELAAQARVALLQRISRGGAKMPAFPDLNPLETEALIAYIDQLAGIPGAEHRQIQIDEPVARAGEHLVKSTCHICHDANGRKPSVEAMMQGDIPPLSVLTRSKSMETFVQKVTRGATVMGVADLPYRGRMPVFYYLKPEEAAAAYFYLSTYPPGAPANVGTRAVEADVRSQTRKRAVFTPAAATRSHP